MDLKLLVVQGKPEGKEIPIQVSRFLVGRSVECHLRPNSELISRHHCQIAVNGNKVSIVDLGSSNGTIVNGERITEEVPLGDGDLIQVGPLGFQVLLQGAADTVIEVSDAPDEARALAPQPAATAAPATPAATPTTPVQSGKLGSKEARADDIAQWLVGDRKNPVPDSGSGVYSGDTQQFSIEALNDTAPDVSPTATTPPDGIPNQVAPGDEVVLADGRKAKVGSSKQVIEKTREDTSRAAGDILRRMMERRPK